MYIYSSAAAYNINALTHRSAHQWQFCFQTMGAKHWGAPCPLCFQTLSKYSIGVRPSGHLLYETTFGRLLPSHVCTLSATAANR